MKAIIIKTNDVECFEEKINKFIKGKKVIDIKVCIVQTSQGLRSNYADLTYFATIMYEEGE